eukprot:scaffold5657_cov270-Pinguiococcus_pyrenoidosus.AAC.1
MITTFLRLGETCGASFESRHRHASLSKSADVLFVYNSGSQGGLHVGSSLPQLGSSTLCCRSLRGKASLCSAEWTTDAHRAVVWKMRRHLAPLLLVCLSISSGSGAEEHAIPVFIYDHETLRTVLPGDATYNSTFNGYATPSLGGLVELLEDEGRHFADLELALGIRPAVEKSPKFTLTENPDDAEFILVSIYEQAVCFHYSLARYLIE